MHTKIIWDEKSCKNAVQVQLKHDIEKEVDMYTLDLDKYLWHSYCSFFLYNTHGYQKSQQMTKPKMNDRGLQMQMMDI